MSVDRAMAIRSAVSQSVDHTLPDASRAVDDCALPRPRDARRLLALQEALGDIAAGISRGRTDMSELWLLVAAIAQDAVEEIMVEDAGRPVSPEDFLR